MFAAEVEKLSAAQDRSTRPNTCFYRKRKHADGRTLTETVKKLSKVVGELRELVEEKDQHSGVPQEIAQLLAGHTLFWLDPEAEEPRDPSNSLSDNWPQVFDSSFTKKLLESSTSLWTWTRRAEIVVETKMEGYKFRDFGESEWDGDLPPEVLEGTTDPTPLFPNFEDIREFARDVTVMKKEVFSVSGDPTDGDAVISKSKQEIFITFLSTNPPVNSE